MNRKKPRKEKKTPDLRTVKRDAESDKIGRIGHRDLCNRFEEFDWIPGNIDPDKGEDLLVRIYNAGRFTGLSFYAQIKSTTNVDAMIDEEADAIKYSAATKDLDHWNSSGVPVFLFVWDVNAKNGYWIEITDDLIRQLESDNKNWRTQGSVTIYIPKANQTDDVGLNRIRKILTERFAPIYTTSKTLTLSLKAEFPNTPEGKSLQEKMIRWRDAGDAVILPAPYIKEFVASDWFERLHGPITLTSNASISIASAASTEDTPVRLEVISPQGRLIASLKLILRVVKRGEIEMTLDNKHYPTPFVCTLVLKTEKGGIRFSVNITVKKSKPSSQEAFAALPFWKGMAGGGILKVSFGAPDKIFNLETTIEGDKWPMPTEEEERAFENLAFIEQKINDPIIVPEWALSLRDCFDIQQLKTIVETGRITEELESHCFTLGEPKSPADAKELISVLLKVAEEGRDLEGTIVMAETPFDVLGSTVELGPSRYNVKGQLAPETVTMLEAAKKTPDSVNELSVTVSNSQVVHTFDRWLPESELEDGDEPVNA